jgi:hypothetical protein
MGMARFALVLLLALVSLPRPEAVSFYVVLDDQAQLPCE